MTLCSERSCATRSGAGRHIYHFENLCRENPGIRLGDGTEKIFLNTEGIVDGAEEDMKNLLKYFQSLTPQDAYTKELDEAVAAAREHREWRLEYMKMEAWEQDIRRESRAEGRIEGKIEGRIEGEFINLVGQVYRKVLKGKSPEEIAEDLAEDVSRIKRIYDAVVKYLPDYDPEKILKELGRGEMPADANGEPVP